MASTAEIGDDRTTSLRVATWNIAAVNNNPFEYFVTHDDPAYNSLMAEVEAFIEEPGERDVTVGELIDDAMFDELEALMNEEGFVGVAETAEYWRANLKNRRLVSEARPSTRTFISSTQRS